MATNFHENSTPEMQERAKSLRSWMSKLGVPQGELAAAAKVDRGTLSRALKADPGTWAHDERTWNKLAKGVAKIEAELEIETQMTADGSFVTPEYAAGWATATIDYKNGSVEARITLSTKAEGIAEAIREVLIGGVKEEPKPRTRTRKAAAKKTAE